jgi:hypothetical protein
MSKTTSAELKADAVPAYALAGNATITLLSGNTDRHFTYKIKKSKDNENLYFINLLSGPDNDNDYQYIGCYYSDTEYFHPAKPWKDRVTMAWPPSLRAIRFFLSKLYNIPDNLHVFHEGRCGRCGRKLTTPESIERGLGPECLTALIEQHLIERNNKLQ